jgi:ribosomal protein L29
VSGEGGLSPGSSPQAGSAKSNGSQKPGSEIEKASGSGVQDKVMSAQVKQYLVRIRTQTATGESKLKEEEIVRTYRKEIEGVRAYFKKRKSP